jgi:hypothetical protein
VSENRDIRDFPFREFNQWLWGISEGQGCPDDAYERALQLAFDCDKRIEQAFDSRDFTRLEWAEEMEELRHRVAMTLITHAKASRAIYYPPRVSRCCNAPVRVADYEGSPYFQCAVCGHAD